MAQKKSVKKTPKTNKGEQPASFWDSPTKVIGLCAAFLILSLTSGMLIGSFLDDEGLEESDNGVAIQPAEMPQNNVAVQPYPTYEEGLIPDLKEPVPEIKLPKVEPEVAALPPEEVKPAKPPVMSKQDGPAWERFAAPTEPLEGRPAIAIVIDDVGINKSRVADLANLPGAITLAFLPYATGLQESVDLTRSKGHEAMVHMPMEPTRESANPGPDALLTSLSLEEIAERTRKNLSQFDGYVGLNNHMGSKFTAYREGMQVVMDIAAEKGLLFLDSRTTAQSTGYELAKERGMLTGNRDVFIDNKAEEAAILLQLGKVEEMARKNGTAIAIGHPYKQTIAALQKWVPEAQRKGFVLVPITAALKSN